MTLVNFLYGGRHDLGIAIDKKSAFQLIEEGVSKGYRSVYGMYSDYLRDRGDERYFGFLIEYIRYYEIELEAERISMKQNNNYSYLIRGIHIRNLVNKYRTAAEAYLYGFGVEKNVSQAIVYIKKALNYSDDANTIYLYASILNGYYGDNYANYDESIKVLKTPSLVYEKGNYHFALLGDAYFGKDWKNFFKANQYYNNYPKIKEFKSKIRERFCKFRKYIIFSTLILVIILVLLII